MKYIGFNNFRKFENFKNLEIAPITLLVGGNNAGKSSVVKGILAVSDFFNNRNNVLDIDMIARDEDVREVLRAKKEALKDIKFSFNSSYLAHIGTFKRALFNKAKDSVITFRTDYGMYDLEIEVSGNRSDEELVYGRVSKVRLSLDELDFHIEFDLNEDEATLVFHHKSSEIAETNKHLPSVINLKEYFSGFTKDYSIICDISSNWSPFRMDIIGSLMESVEMSIDATIYPDKIDRRDVGYRSLHPSPIANIDNDTISFIKHYCKIIQKGPVGPRRYEGFRFPFIRVPLYRTANIEYLYAHAVTQTVIYSAKDTNDYLSKTIHEFAPLQSHKSKREFIIKWMKEFGIGQNFVIKSVGGEAHLVWIVNNDGEKVNLADKGMGTIQLMVLLFRLAITLPKISRKSLMFSDRFGKIVIIEEPEQNLHPRLQSKLADLFYDLYTNYGYRFLIETHSEYLIRRSQVIVAEANYESEEDLKKRNPFTVYYFDDKNEKEPYYQMEYELSGAFKQKFGEGFFDEATKWDMTIIRKEFEIKKRNKK